MALTQSEQHKRISNAVAFLKLARDALKDTEATRALARVRTALKSTEGALRHRKDYMAKQVHIPKSWGI
jgi:hypothetical protein